MTKNLYWKKFINVENNGQKRVMRPLLSILDRVHKDHLGNYFKTTNHIILPKENTIKTRYNNLICKILVRNTTFNIDDQTPFDGGYKE